MGTLTQDIHYAARMLRRSPGFTLIAVLTLALGIGANSAIFSVVNGVLLNPLPYPHPEQLLRVHESKPNFDTGSISYPNFRDWEKQNTVFSALAISRTYSFSLTGSGKAEQLNGQFISAELFRLLGVKPILGRDLAPGEDQIGAAPLAMLDEGVWKRKFGASPDILGKGITLDGRTYTVIGVMPASFDLLRSRDVYVGIGQWENPFLVKRGAGLGIHGFARLKPGVTFEQARADMARISKNLAAAYPDTNQGIGAALIPLKEELVGDIRPVLLVLMGAVGFVLLIACVNIANLLLARATGRSREFAIRAALGASRSRVVRQLLTESILLSLLGGGLGLLLAAWGTQAALAILPITLYRAKDIGVDSHVLLFTLAIALFAGLLFGLAPAFKTAQPDLNETLKQGGRGLSGLRHRAQSALSVMEIALALVLLVGAGLMIRSLAHLWGVDPGFNPQNLWTFGVLLPPSMHDASKPALRASFRELERRLRATPGITGAALSWGASPLANDDEWLFWLDNQPEPANDKDLQWTLDYVVSPDYLKVMQTPLLRGRFFTAQDDENAPKVAVVDEVFAKKFFPNGDAIGHRINVKGNNRNIEIVGVVGHVKQWGLDTDDRESVRAQMYTPVMQLPDAAIGGGIGVVARFQGSSAAALQSIQRTSDEMNGEQVIVSPQTMDDIISSSLASHRFSMILLGAFAALALLLASVGVYGVISFMVGQRTHEIGVRMALGARRSDILRLVLGRGGKLAVVGIVLGFFAALILTRLMASQLYGVSATDPLTFTAVAALLCGVALFACYIPAHHASRVDPMVALHYE